MAATQEVTMQPPTAKVHNREKVIIINGKVTRINRMGHYFHFLMFSEGMNVE